MKEEEIRPQHLFQQYVKLSGEDAKIFFGDVQRIDVPCVACGSKKNHFYTKKDGFSYSKCNFCRTVYVTPRPNSESFDHFYRESKSSKYWANTFYPAVAEARREKIFRPRVDMLASLCVRHDIEVNQLIDIGAGFGIFLEEWQKQYPSVEILAVEPSGSLARECISKGLKVEQKTAEELKGYDNYADLVVCFEVLEHVFDPLAFVTRLKKLVKKGGYLFLTTLSIDGFDLEILGKRSPQISPPHHINFLSVIGFEKLFLRAGFSEIEVTTPGKLDVDIVRNFSRKEPNILDNNHFLKLVFKAEARRVAFQTFLSENQLSSHAWVLGKNP